MKIVVIGGSGFIGAKLVRLFRDCGHEVVAASPSTGVNSITGEGLAEALVGARVVADVTNSPSLDPSVAMAFFQTSTRNLIAGEKAARVTHHVTLSIVGADRLTGGYFRAKLAQERLIRASTIPYTIVRSTQFFEFIDQIVRHGADGDNVRLPRAKLQPIFSDDAVAALADFALAAPCNDVVELAGPEAIELIELARELLSARELPHCLIADPQALYFGATVQECSLTPGPRARLTSSTFADWLRRSIPAG